MTGKTLQEANETWKRGGDVICPYCENHVHEDEWALFCDEVHHAECAHAAKRQAELDDEQATAHDHQQD
jgi:hypothetical protein